MYVKVWKRFLDILISLLVFPFFVILYVIVGAAILCDDHGPIFYKADRLGKGGRIFKMYKFRSMKVNAPDLRNADGTTFNSRNDSRVTRVGQVLRRTSIDEVPQIINVIKGDMSFVGPRPDLPDAMNIYSEKDKNKLKVLPGITGYSQAYYRNASTLEQRFAGDSYYADHLSFIMDAKIIVKSFHTVLTRKNVYRNGEEDEASHRSV